MTRLIAFLIGSCIGTAAALVVIVALEWHRSTGYTPRPMTPMIVQEEVKKA